MFHSVVPDAIAAIVIGGILGLLAILLAVETKALLLGESADPAILTEVEQIASQDPSIVRVEKPLTMHLGPREILLNMAVQFPSDLSGEAVIKTVDRLESSIRSRFPDIQQILIEASSLSGPGHSQRRRELML